MSVHIQCQASIVLYTFVVSREFMAGASSQAGDADSSRAPGLTSGLQGSMNAYRSALLMVPQWQCNNSFVLHMCCIWLSYTKCSCYRHYPCTCRNREKGRDLTESDPVTLSRLGSPTRQALKSASVGIKSAKVGERSRYIGVCRG